MEVVSEDCSPNQKEEVLSHILKMVRHFPESASIIKVTVIKIFAPSRRLSSLFREVIKDADEDIPPSEIRDYFYRNGLKDFHYYLRHRKKRELLGEIYEDLHFCSNSDNMFEKYGELLNLVESLISPEQSEIFGDLIGKSAAKNVERIVIGLKSFHAHIECVLRGEEKLDEDRSKQLKRLFDQLERMLLTLTVFPTTDKPPKL